MWSFYRSKSRKFLGKSYYIYVYVRTMKRHKIIFALLLSALTLYLIFRPSNAKLRADMDSKNHTTTIIKAAYKLGERKDKLAIKPLLANILDPRVSTNMNFKGMSVCYCKLGALKKISNLSPPIELNQFSVDTIAAKFYLDWAIKEKFIEPGEEIDLTYYK